MATKIKLSMTPKRPIHLGRIGNGVRPGLKRALKGVDKLVKRGIKRNLSGAVLQRRSGRLFRSVKSDINPAPQGWSLETYISLTEVPYARIHELGGRTGRKHATRIPKRPYMRKAFVDAKDLIRAMLRDFVVKLSR